MKFKIAGIFLTINLLSTLHATPFNLMDNSVIRGGRIAGENFLIPEL